MNASGNQRGGADREQAEETHTVRSTVRSSCGSSNPTPCSVNQVARALLIATGVFAGMLLWSRLKIVSETPRSAFADPKAERDGRGIEAASPSSSRNTEPKRSFEVQNGLQLMISGAEAAVDHEQVEGVGAQVDEDTGFVPESATDAPR